MLFDFRNDGSFEGWDSYITAQNTGSRIVVVDSAAIIDSLGDCLLCCKRVHFRCVLASDCDRDDLSVDIADQIGFSGFANPCLCDHNLIDGIKTYPGGDSPAQEAVDGDGPDQ